MDPATREALVCAIDDAKARGWLQPDLRRYFKQRDIDFSVYAAAKRGEAVDCEAASVFAQISITGLPVLPYAPNPDDIRSHIDWLTEPARGQFDDALFEIAYDGEGRGPSMARLFALDEIDAAVAFAAAKNIEGRNLYIGAALRAPDTDRNKRSTGDDFYVATAVPIDIDHEYDATRARMASICDDGLVVTTGLTPERRSQHWTRLNEPCDDDLAFEHAFGALVAHTGADMKVKDKARIMRLGGTVSFPRDAKKLAAGYCTELTVVALNVAARTSDIDALQALEPGTGGGSHPGQNFDTSNRPQAGLGGGIERRGITGSGVVFNGREAHFRDLLLRHLSAYQRDTGADPSFEELWEAAWVDFSDPTKVDNADGRWTSAQGQVELRQRVQNTFRRLRSGRLARFGLYSIDTGAGQDEALAVQAARAATQPPQRREPETTVETTATEVGSLGFRLTDWTVDRYRGDAKPIEWLCEGTVPLGIPVLFAAMGGMGKSFMALDMGLEVAVATTSIAPRVILGGQIMQTGRAVILSAEDSRDSIHRRLEKIDGGRRRDRDPDKLMIVPLPDTGGPRPLIASDGKTLSMTPAFHDLVAQLSAVEDLKLVVIDPLQAFVMADINADPAAGQFMWSAFASLCAVTGATVIVCHHMRKQGAMTIRTPDEAREAIRGSTALVDGARLTFALWKTPDEDARDLCVRLDIPFAPDLIAGGAVVKANDEADRNPRTYVRQESGLLVDATDRLSIARAGERVSTKTAQEIITEIDRAWNEAAQGRGEGYAMSPQSGDRQAWKLVVRRTGCTPKEAKELAAAWVANGILQMQTVNSKLHRAALRAVGRLE